MRDELERALVKQVVFDKNGYLCYITVMLTKEFQLKACIFCQISEGILPCHKVYEDDYHLGFLSTAPNTLGFSVLITKEHWSSDVLAMPDENYIEFQLAVREAAKKITASLPGVGRTGVIIEGFGVDHAHAKLAPMHGTEMVEWKPIPSKKQQRFERYEGFLSSCGGPPATNDELAQIARIINNPPTNTQGAVQAKEPKDDPAV